MEEAENAVALGERLLALGDRLGVAALVVLVLVLGWLVRALMRGEMIPKYIYQATKDELDERRKLDREEERLSERSLSVTEKAAVLAADMAASIIERRATPRQSREPQEWRNERDHRDDRHEREGHSGKEAPPQ